MLRVGMLGVAHVHAPSYAHCLANREDAKLVGVFDHDRDRATSFSSSWKTAPLELEEFHSLVDAVVVCSENTKHLEYIELAASSGKPVLCEKPLAPSRKHYDAIKKVLDTTHIMLMTAFPCPFSPVFQRLKERVDSGEIGNIVAVNATNRGRCPFGWFVDPDQSGGGAMIDHVVHVADLLYRLLGERPTSVCAQIGNNMYGESWDDTAHLTIGFPSGVFATLDSSWSRPQNYKTWGDVTLKVVGDQGVIEADLFGQGLLVLTDRARMTGTASDIDRLMVDEFLNAVREKRTPIVTADDGLAASLVALSGYESASVGQSVTLA